ncbi:hypothetical protein BBJ29_005388 [Phytophthora kernoviae]|uniref:alpha,alpha-trehalase n=1 Tax=Phytophthora kernoviae TaxID=325452 RepID=A0A3F2RQ33_9STRA|nr:hypothetical protein BBJ29_005388 [Phytophthora kernoviae]RLN60872.1 hypothetical protein BBP00_00005750 [Phytophthora kernoviae]
MPVEDDAPEGVTPRQRNIQQLQRVYCRGELLHEVQMLELFPDSKHFVDMPIKNSSSVDEVLTQFQEQKNTYGSEKDWKERLIAFVNQHFDPPGAELVPTTPPDFQDDEIPLQIAQIANATLRDWAMELHKLWKILARVPASTSADQISRSSFLHSLPIAAAPNGPHSPLSRQFHGENVLVVPGGRFRESYYWDSYWIVQGLLASGLRQTARGVVTHLLEFVAEFGFVPNGGRIYYLTRSQPPMLSDMVRLITKLEEGNGAEENTAAWDLEYLRAAVPLLEREYSFWMHRGAHGHAVEIPVSGSNGNPTRVDKIVASLEKSGLVQEGGVQTTTTVTGQQWDAPNAWPPLQDIIIEGLLTAGTPKSRLLAKRLIQTWVKAGLMAWQETGLMFEKYNAQQLGGVGNGGEYTPQFGFGWSNGVILTLLTKYQAQLGDTAVVS